MIPHLNNYVKLDYPGEILLNHNETMIKEKNTITL